MHSPRRHNTFDLHVLLQLCLPLGSKDSTDSGLPPCLACLPSTSNHR